MYLRRIQELAGRESQGQIVVSFYSIVKAGVLKDAHLFVVCFGRASAPSCIASASIRALSSLGLQS